MNALEREQILISTGQFSVRFIPSYIATIGEWKTLDVNEQGGLLAESQKARNESESEGSGKNGIQFKSDFFTFVDSNSLEESVIRRVKTESLRMTLNKFQRSRRRTLLPAAERYKIRHAVDDATLLVCLNM